jgi:hypothetical protein
MPSKISRGIYWLKTGSFGGKIPQWYLLRILPDLGIVSDCAQIDWNAIFEMGKVKPY